MTLLICRDKTLLEKCEGTAKVDKDVPEKLKQTMIVAPRTLLIPPEVCRLEDKLITSEAERLKLKRFLKLKLTAGIPALWAGYRSVIVDGLNGELYKLKGVTINLERPEISDSIWSYDPEIFGGQYKYGAKYEQQMSDEFNKALAKEGIEPVMEFKGYWNYKLKVNKKPISASVMRIKGDTRLDELMDTIEQILFQRIMLDTPNKKGKIILKKINSLYRDLGFVVGRLKRLMNKNNQSWGSDPHRTNAHTGNIVLYADNANLRLGFVDFDASSSCKIDKLELSKIKEFQRGDYHSIICYAHQKQCSSRRIAGDKYGVLSLNDNHIYNNFLRDTFCQGFQKGHDDEIHDKKLFDNKIPLEQLMGIMLMLKSGNSLSKEENKDKLCDHKTVQLCDLDFMRSLYCNHVRALLSNTS